MSGSSKKLLHAAAGNAGSDPLYVEDVFSTFLYQGTESSQDIDNNIDLSTEGGLVWIKNRDATDSHILTDTARGVTKIVSADTTAQEATDTDTLTAFNDDGFTIGADAKVNTDAEDYVSWTFRKAEKFFDIVTYTGTGSERTVSHNLGSVPRIMIIKRTNGTGGWWIYSKDWVDANSSLGVALNLSNSDAGLTGYDTDFFWGANPTNSVFSVGTYGEVNGNNNTYVAYLFASDAGGFGDDEDENIIKCGTYTGNANATGPEIDLGFEPQWIYAKAASASGVHGIVDVMRGMPVGGSEGDLILFPDNSGVEINQINLAPTATGFKLEDDGTFLNQNNVVYIYMAIRRPMKTPTAGTEVFNTLAYTGNGASTRNYDIGITVDAVFQACRSDTNDDKKALSARVTQGKALQTTAVSAVEYDVNYDFDFQTGVRQTGADTKINQNSETFFMHGFKRAPGFFDIVAYQGNSSANRTIAHNLGVIPELSIYKHRYGGDDAWWIHTAETAVTESFLFANAGAVRTNQSYWNTRPTASVFTVQATSAVNGNYPYISYHWATLEGVSKVGKYTGTGNDVDVDCGFAAGARFLLIKRINGSGAWFLWDSARGIIAGNDPSIVMNTSAAEVTDTDYIDPLAAGFTVTASAPDALNVNNGTYLFLAIA